MSRREIETILEQVEQLLATGGTLPAEVEEAVEKLLNVVESLSSHNQSLLDGHLHDAGTDGKAARHQCYAVAGLK